VMFGFGGESLGVAQGTLVASWFKHSELGKHELIPMDAGLLMHMSCVQLSHSAST
jgi:hypothetical protein